MRVVFLGTPEFGVPSLKALVSAGYEVVGVFTQPDKPKGRGTFPSTYFFLCKVQHLGD